MLRAVRKRDHAGLGLDRRPTGSNPFLAGRNHVCAFFNTIDEEHRVLGSLYKDGLDRGEKAAHIVDPANREEHLKRLAEAGIRVQEMMYGQHRALDVSRV
jgi:MEDS: MEthanogen/methylotroph, DcmR Sensory domain